MHRAAVELRQGRAQALLLRLAQRHRGDHRGDHPPATGGSQLGQGLESLFQATATRPGDEPGDQPEGDLVGTGAEKGVQQPGLGGLRGGGVGEGGAQRAVGGDDPGEPEHLVLDAVESAPALGLGEVRVGGQLLQGVHQVARTRPAGTHHAGHQVGGGAADLATEEALDELGLGLALLRRVGENPAQRDLTVEQRGDVGQLGGERAGVDGRVVRQRVETLTCGSQCLSARSVHRVASAFVAASSSPSRNRSMVRLWRACSSSDSPTILPASSVAS